MVKIMHDRGHNFETSAEREIVRDIKEQISYVTLDFKGDSRKAATSTLLGIFYKTKK